MANLNRFPLLGLWAKEAARRLGYNEEDAATLGHAYAVLYAIRANSVPRKSRHQDEEETGASVGPNTRPEVDVLDFSGDRLEVTRDDKGRLTGRVGGAAPQTPRSYRVSVQGKFTADYYQKLEKAFRAVWDTLGPGSIENRLVYKLYDQWKKVCASGRLIDLDKLLQWCQERGKSKT